MNITPCKKFIYAWSLFLDKNDDYEIRGRRFKFQNIFGNGAYKFQDSVYHSDDENDEL